jgi:hypothetical protein
VAHLSQAATGVADNDKGVKRSRHGARRLGIRRALVHKGRCGDQQCAGLHSSRFNSTHSSIPGPSGDGPSGCAACKAWRRPWRGGLRPPVQPDNLDATANITERGDP